MVDRPVFEKTIAVGDVAILNEDALCAFVEQDRTVAVSWKWQFRILMLLCPMIAVPPPLPDAPSAARVPTKLRPSIKVSPVTCARRIAGPAADAVAAAAMKWRRVSRLVKISNLSLWQHHFQTASNRAEGRRYINGENG